MPGRRHVEPDEVAAFGATPFRDRRHVPLERLEHRVAAGLEEPVDPLEVRLEVPAADELVNGRLSKERRRDVGRHRERLDLRRKLGRQHEVADAYPRRDRLREGRRVDDVRRLPRARTASAAPRPRSGRARRDRPRERAGRARARSRRRGGGAPPRACGRSDSGTSRSCRGTPASRRPRARARAPRDAGPRRPSASGTISAPRRARIFIGRSYVGASTSTRVPGFTSCSKRKTKPCSEPLVIDDAGRLDAVPLGDPLPQRRIAAARPIGEDGCAVASIAARAQSASSSTAGIQAPERRAQRRSEPCRQPSERSGRRARSPDRAARTRARCALFRPSPSRSRRRRRRRARGGSVRFP